MPVCPGIAGASIGGSFLRGRIIRFKAECADRVDTADLHSFYKNIDRAASPVSPFSFREDGSQPRRGEYAHKWAGWVLG